MPERKAADPIAALFPAELIEARFVVAMAIARNDIKLSLRDGIAAAREDRQDFPYRVRLATSHLVEALDSLNAYTQESADTRKLMARVAPDLRRELTKARGVVQEVSSSALEHVRNNTFHYPSPRTSYRPNSDEQLGAILAQMGNHPATLHLDHRSEHPVITLRFAVDVALALALDEHSADEETARRQFELTSEGAVAFVKWVDGLLVAYLDATGAYLGTPQLLPEADESV